MKKKLCLLILSSLLLLCACSVTPAAVKDKPAVEGYAYYESVNGGIKLQYPENWISISSDTLNDPDFLNEAEQLLGMSEDLLKNALNQTDSFFYNIDSATDDFTPSLNLVITESPGASQRQLKGSATLNALKQQLETSMGQTFSNFSIVSDPENKTLEGNLFVVYQMDYTMGSVRVFAYQAITANNGKIYTLTYSEQEELDESKIAELDKILSTIELS